MTACDPRTGDPRPNVVWVLVDQMRAQAFSLAGDVNLRTPNLDRLARDGAWFRRALSGDPLCCPARGSLLTGAYPHRCVPGHEYPLPEGLPTLAQSFAGAGYHTCWLGKWHLDGHREGPLPERGAWHIVPRERRGGFATWLGYDNNNAPWDSWLHGHTPSGEHALQRLPGHETEALTDLLLAEIAAHRDEPFFACLSVQPPHNPYTAPARWLERHPPAGIALRPNVPPIPRLQEQARRDLARYYALIEHIDHQVGRLLDHLEALGIAESTYVVFVSDHGDMHGSHGHLRKMTPYEEAIRVPLMIWGGHRWRYGEGRVIDAPFNHVDLAPTSLGLCGIPVPGHMAGYDYAGAVRPLPGRDAAAVLATAPAEAYLQCVVPTGHGDSVDLPWRGLVTADGWKYVALEGQPWLLFNLAEDPCELVNLAHYAQARQRRRELNQRLGEWIERLGDRFTLPRFTADGVPEGALAAATAWPPPPGR